jgi:hypothetical protein
MRKCGVTYARVTAGRGLWFGLLLLALVLGLLQPLPSSSATPVSAAGSPVATAVRAASSPVIVPPELFGMQVGSIGAGAPTNLRAGAIRLWDAKVSWRRVEPQRGQFTWDVLDAAVANAQAVGATEILYTVGVVPTWAASNMYPALYGPGTAAHPADNADYINFVTAVAARYKGRITSYQLWNEVNLDIFYNGAPSQLADLVQQASAAIKAVDPQASIVAPSALAGPNGPWYPFSEEFAREMQARGWPVDAVSMHLYAPPDQGPATRVEYLLAAKRWFQGYGWNGPMWDTETSYGDRRPGTNIRVYTGKQAATYVARTYIDSMRYGVPRVFWYGWEVDILGIDLTVAGQRTPAGDAYLTVSRWMSGSRWKGCKRVGRVTTCKMVRGGTRYEIKYASKRTRITLPSGTRSWASLDGTTHKARAGKRITLTTAPILVRR